MLRRLKYQYLNQNLNYLNNLLKCKHKQIVYLCMHTDNINVSPLTRQRLNAKFDILCEAQTLPTKVQRHY